MIGNLDIEMTCAKRAKIFMDMVLGNLALTAVFFATDDDSGFVGSSGCDRIEFAPSLLSLLRLCCRYIIVSSIDCWLCFQLHWLLEQLGRHD